MLKKVDVPLHPKALVACPRTNFNMVVAAGSCDKCEHWAGVGMMSSDETLPWDKRFAIRCAHVMERRTHILEVVG